MKIGVYDVNNIYHSDVVEFMKEIPDESIDLIFVDFPFSYIKIKNSDKKIKSYKKISEFMEEASSEYYRILKHNGNIAIFWQSIMAYRYTKYFSDKFEVMNIVAIKDRIKWSWKYLPYQYNLLYLLCKGRPSYYWQKIEGLTDLWLDTDVMKGKKYHKEQISQEIVRRVLLMITREGDLVFDSFVGGNIVVTCKEMSRNFIGCDIDESTIKLAKERLSKTVIKKDLLKEVVK